MQKSPGIPSAHAKRPDQEDDSDDPRSLSFEERPDMVITANSSAQHLSPALSRLLDVLVNLAQIGPSKMAITSGGRGLKSSNSKTIGHSMSRTSSIDQIVDELWEKENNKVKDLEAIQVLLEIFLKAGNRELQEEVLNRMFKIFSSHIENYKICQELRTVPLFIQNMAGFPQSFQEIILKILEYAVTVVNCVPEQELLSLSCLLQQPITSELKHTILSFFVKLLSFDQQYKKVLREVGVLAVLLDDLKQHRFLLGSDQHNRNHNQLERKISSSSFNKHLDCKDVIISSPRLLESGSGKFPIFEVDATIDLAWDCFVSLLKKSESNQAAFRGADGVPTILPFLASGTHRQGALRILSCLIIEDVSQVCGHCSYIFISFLSYFLACSSILQAVYVYISNVFVIYLLRVLLGMGVQMTRYIWWHGSLDCFLPAANATYQICSQTFSVERNFKVLKLLNFFF